MQEQKIWGTTESVFESRTITIHVLRVKKGGVCSWHYHDRKYNHFHVISGRFAVRVKVNDSYRTFDMEPGEQFTVGPGVDSRHEFEAVEDSVVIETCYVKRGRIRPNDIHRLRLGYYDHGDGKVDHAPDDGTVENLP